MNGIKQIKKNNPSRLNKNIPISESYSLYFISTENNAHSAEVNNTRSINGEKIKFEKLNEVTAIIRPIKLVIIKNKDKVDIFSLSIILENKIINIG